MKINFMPVITGDDDLTVEPSYVWWAIGMISYLVLTGWKMMNGQMVDLQSFATGLGIVLAAGGAGRMMGK